MRGRTATLAIAIATAIACGGGSPSPMTGAPPVPVATAATPSAPMSVLAIDARRCELVRVDLPGAPKDIAKVGDPDCATWHVADAPGGQIALYVAPFDVGRFSVAAVRLRSGTGAWKNPQPDDTAGLTGVDVRGGTVLVTDSTGDIVAVRLNDLSTVWDGKKAGFDPDTIAVLP